MNRPIVTLTSIPPRFDGIGPVLLSLLRQSLQPEAVVLYIPRHYRRFPDWNGALPAVPDGVRIVRSPRDYGPATKILPAMRDFSAAGRALICCDDDFVYPEDFVERLTKAGNAHPDHVVALSGAELTGAAPKDRRAPRAKRRSERSDLRYQAQCLWRRVDHRIMPVRRPFRNSGYVDLFDSASGVLMRPGMLDEKAYAIPNLVWAADDVWLSGALAVRKVPIWVEANAAVPCGVTGASNPSGDRGNGQGNPATREAAIAYMRQNYRIWI